MCSTSIRLSQGRQASLARVRLGAHRAPFDSRIVGDLYVVEVNTHDIYIVSFGGNPRSAGRHLSTIGSIPGGSQLTDLEFSDSGQRNALHHGAGNESARCLQADRGAFLLSGYGTMKRPISAAVP